MNNIVLIGMPGCGKSTCGVLLAKALCMNFEDTDLIIQNVEGEPLQDIINNKGNGYFTKTEEKTVCSTEFNNTVVATGGSVVYSKKAMEHLGENSTIVYLKISYNTMIERISNIKTRGIVLKNGETLDEMYNERKDLYEKYADIIIDCDFSDIEKTVLEIKEKTEQMNKSKPPV